MLSTDAVDPRTLWADAERRREAQARHQQELRIPRRPRWSRGMTRRQLETKERESFVQWRRRLAK